ncbi:hypothetical protein VPHK469_0123 [Vibrio phage K469]
MSIRSFFAHWRQQLFPNSCEGSPKAFMADVDQFKGQFVKEPELDVELQFTNFDASEFHTPKPIPTISVFVDGKWWIEIDGHVRVNPSMVKHTAKQIRRARANVSIQQHGIK